MGTKLTTVLDLASAQIKAKDSEKAIAELKRKVKANANAWRNDIFAKEQAVEAAQDVIEALACDATASTDQVLAAEDALALAQRNHDRVVELAAVRFGS